MTDENGEKKFCHKSGKVCMTESEAGFILNRSKAHYKSKNGRKMSKVKDYKVKRKYRCEYCGYIHLTHQPYYGMPKKKKGWKYGR